MGNENYYELAKKDEHFKAVLLLVKQLIKTEKLAKSKGIQFRTHGDVWEILGQNNAGNQKWTYGYMLDNLISYSEKRLHTKIEKSASELIEIMKDSGTSELVYSLPDGVISSYENKLACAMMFFYLNTSI